MDKSATVRKCTTPNVDDFYTDVELCLKSTWFTFNDELHLQIYGVAMGSPFSVRIANIVMKYLEIEILQYLQIRPTLF